MQQQFEAYTLYIYIYIYIYIYNDLLKVIYIVYIIHIYDYI